MTLVRYNPYRNLVSLPRQLNRFFNDFGLDADFSDTVWSPNVDIAETDDQYELKAEIPGLSKKEIKISVENNVLTLSGEKKHEEETNKKNFHRIETSYGRFERSFQLPEQVKAEEIKARYNNGVLTVEIPKAEKVKPKEIAVS